MSNTPQVVYQMNGTVKEVLPIEMIGKFTKRMIIIADTLGNNQAFEATFELAQSLDSFVPGTEVKVEFALDSRYWNPAIKDPTDKRPPRWFQGISLVSLNVTAAAAPGTAPVAAPEETQAAPAAQPVTNVAF